MKITAILGSPIKNGNSTQMVDHLLSGFSEDNIKVFRLNDLSIKGCQACNECKKSDSIICAQNDELQPVLNRLAETDLLVLASPIYMDQITAQMRIFQDRLNVFLRSDFSTKQKDTPTVLLFSQAVEDAEGYKDYFKTLKKVYKKFNMNVIDIVVLPDAPEHDELKDHPEVISYLDKWKNCNLKKINL